MSKWKSSKYNIYGRMQDGDFLIYNTLSSCVGKITSEEMKALNNDQYKDSDFLEECKQLGFVVNGEEDEFAKIMALRKMNNYNMHRAGFQILPTTGCNARCFYCYEQDYVSQTMSSETVEQTIAFIKQYISSMNEVSIAWFGGEPLLYFDVIEYMSKELIQYCQENSIQYSSNMITNAILLDDEIISKLHTYKIETVQITLDGYQDIHDSRKNYMMDNANYNMVVGNIKKLVDSKIKVLVRINIDRKNFNSCLEAIRDLKNTCGVNNYIWPYLAPLYSDKDDKDCFTKEELNHIFSKGYKMLIDCGYIQTIDGLPMNFMNAACCATMINNFVITPSGDIYKCEHLLGDETDKVGDIFNGIVFNSAMKEWTHDDLPAECTECEYLPICQAGCKAAVKRKFGYGRCSYIRYTTQATIAAANYLYDRENIQM